jgi:hypothetical protein
MDDDNYFAIASNVVKAVIVGKPDDRVTKMVYVKREGINRVARVGWTYDAQTGQFSAPEQ